MRSPPTHRLLTNAGAPEFLPLRADAPGRKEYKKGTDPGPLSEEGRAKAWTVFQEGLDAASTRHVVAAKMRTSARFLRYWGFDLYPITVDKVGALGATLKLGGYRTAESYMASASSRPRGAVT